MISYMYVKLKINTFFEVQVLLQLYFDFQAKENGADGIEFDLVFTKDGVPIVFHDDTVDRTTDGTGAISDMTYEEVRKLNAAANYTR